MAFCATLSLGLTTLAAKPLTVPFSSEYQAEIWDLGEGFPENSCSGIAAAPDGYLWLGTFRGLVRFNGQKFRHWGPAAMPELATTSIVNLHRDRSGRIWLSTMEGLVCNDGPHWRRWQEDGGWGDRADYVRNYADAPDGSVAFGRFSGRVMRFERGGFRELPAVPGTGGALCGYDRDGTLYVTRRGFAGFLREGAWQAVAGEPDLARRVLGAGQNRDGDALFVCSKEVLRLHQGRVVGRVPLSREVRNYWQLTADAEGTLWLPSLDAGVYRIKPNGEVMQFLKSDGLPHSGGMRVVHVDANGGIWIGGGVGGLARLRPKRFRYVGEAEGVGDSMILTLAPLRDGRVLMTSYGAGPTYFDGTGTVRMPPLNDPRIASVRTAVRTHDDVIWLGTFSQGLFRLDDGVLSPVATAIFGATESIHTMFEDSQHRLWVGGERRVAVGQGGQFKEILFGAEQQRRQPTLFAEGPDGTVLLTKHNEIYAFTAAGLQAEPLVRLPDDWRISTLLFDAQGRLWIGTTGQGLIVYSEGRWQRYPAAADLPGATISSLVRDDTGYLWFGAGRSIVRTNPAELWQVVQGRAESAPIQVFDSDDGLRDLDLPYGSQPCAAKDEHGRLWFALIRGAAMIDPATLKLNTLPPPVVVESMSHVPYGTSQPIEIALTASSAPPVLPAGSHLIRINYAALDFAAPRKQRFRVRLGDNQGQWQDMQEETTITFLELPPGPHAVQIQASGGDGVWNRTGATLNFVLTPFYWQTAWFRAFLVVGFVGLVGGGAWWGAQVRIRRARENLERERRLAEAQARLALVLENTSDFVAFADPAGQLLYVNRAGRALVGLAPDTDIRPIAAASLLPTWTHRKFNPGTPPPAVPPGPSEDESILRHISGTEIPVSQVLTAHHAPDGRLNFTSVIARDISAAKRHATVQEALRSLATALTAALQTEALGAAVAVAARTLFGHDAFLLAHADQTGEPGTGAYLEDTPEGGNRPQAIPTRGATFDVSLRLVLGGTPLLINRPTDDAVAAALEPWGCATRRSQSLMFAPVLWDGRVTGVVSVQSYTPQRYRQSDLQLLQTLAAHCGAAMARLEAESTLRKNEAQLRQSQKLEAIGTLAGGIAHDFNNILTAILGNVELARLDESTAPSSQEYLDAIYTSGVRARDLVRRMQAFSRPAGNERAPTALRPVVEEVVKLLRATIPASVELGIAAPANLPSAVVNSADLHQVLLNLGTNAWHALHMRPGRIEFTLDTRQVVAGQTSPAPNLLPGDYVRIAVSDTGSGISPEILPRIFDPFFTTKGTGEGTGLGLSVAHGILRANGGAITVQSEVGRGSTFSMYLPVSPTPGSGPAAPATATAPEPGPGRGQRILYVDDESMLVTIVERRLAREGYRVTGCTNPREALAIFRADPAGVDLVVTDYSMPEMTGIEFTAALLHLRPELPVVLTSGYRRPGLAEEARAIGIAAVCDKVDTARELLPLIAQLLRERATPPRP